MIIRDNQAFTLLMLKEKAVYGNEGRGGGAGGRRRATVAGS